MLKLSYLALVYASKKEIDNFKHFRYYSITFYKLKDFNTFIDLIKMRIVKLCIQCRFNFNLDSSGKQKNKGIIFSINKEDIPKLFTKLLEYNADSKEINISSEWYFNK